jgi:hypothetical protein
MQEKLKSYKQILVLFIVLLFICLIASSGYCKHYRDINFDSQELLTWNYFSTTTLLPYKDFYYPYGLLYYANHNNPFIFFFYILISPIIFTGTFLFLKKIWTKNRFLYTSFITFLLFSITKVGIETLSRYGIIFGIALLYSWTFWSETTAKKKFFFIGLLNGIIASLAYDQAFYTISIFVLLTFFSPLIKHQRNLYKSSTFYNELKNKLFWFFSGILVGFAPFLFYLIGTDSFNGFFSNIFTLRDISQYAKTPYIPSIRSSDTIYNLVIILLATIYVLFLHLKQKSGKSLYSYAIHVLLITVLIVEQKSVIRSIDNQITFISYFIVVLLFVELYLTLKKYKISDYAFFIYFILFFIISISRIGTTFLPTMDLSFSNNFLTFDSHSCIVKNIKTNRGLLLDQQKVIIKLKSYKNFNGKVYSYPGDPLFYTLLNQKPPYYSSLYESSPNYAQERLIKFINDENISYVLYNMQNTSIEDGVPNIIRGAKIHEYIIKNFQIHGNVGNFLILQKNNYEIDFLSDKKLNAYKELKKSLFNIDLSTIPKSEGNHKDKYLDKYSKLIIPKTSISNVNKYLKKHTVQSKNKLLVIWSGESIEKESSITISTNEGLKTTITYDNCSMKYPCIINLLHIPLFYNNRQITFISDNKHNLDNVALYDDLNKQIFW